MSDLRGKAVVPDQPEDGEMKRATGPSPQRRTWKTPERPPLLSDGFGPGSPS